MKQEKSYASKAILTDVKRRQRYRYSSALTAVAGRRHTVLRTREQWERVDRAAMTVYPVVQMRRRGSRISCVPDIAEHGARVNAFPGRQMGKALQMSVVMPLAARSKNPQYVAAKLVLAETHHNSLRRGIDRRAPVGKDIDTFMPTASWPWCMPRIT